MERDTVASSERAQGTSWAGANARYLGLEHTGVSAYQGAPYYESQAAIAQLVEHVIRNDGVTGSSPVCGTIRHSVQGLIGPGLRSLGCEGWHNTGNLPEGLS